MNVHQKPLDPDLDRDEAARLLRRLRAWASTASAEEVADVDPALPTLVGGDAQDYPVLSRDFPQDFVASDTYRAGLPDLQNGPASLIRGSESPIQHVGISGFRLPIRYLCRDGGEVTLETAVTGTVSLDADKKGINMSRLMRTFYDRSEEAFSLEVMAETLDAYKADLGSFDARLMMRLSFPLKVPSLRSGLSGYQYYDIALEVIDRAGTRTRVLHLDYVYSSTCPCSLELSEHARRTRGQLATPHSQRSVARLSVVLEPGATLWFEDLIEACRDAVPTETQVMVKREDEQAFAELNAANPIFVEDAARLFAGACLSDPRIGDFRVVASHQESLHSHDAVSVLTSGETFDATGLDPDLFRSMIRR